MTDGPEIPGGRRRARYALWIALTVGAITALLVAVLATSKSAEQAQLTTASPLQGKPAPESLQDRRHRFTVRQRGRAAAKEHASKRD